MPILQSEPLNINDRNNQLPFFPSQSWELSQTDFGVVYGLQPFIWLQAFYSSSLTGPAQLAVFSGKYAADKTTPIVSLVRFAYSGERIPFKGVAIFSSGTDIRGNVITSTPIGEDDAADLLQVIAYGGAY